MVHLARQKDFAYEPCLNRRIGGNVRTQPFQRTMLPLQVLVRYFVHFAHAAARQELNDYESVRQAVASA
jgi:hypothetical protein